MNVVDITLLYQNLCMMEAKYLLRSHILILIIPVFIHCKKLKSLNQIWKKKMKIKSDN